MFYNKNKTLVKLRVSIEIEFNVNQICQRVAKRIKQHESWKICPSLILYSKEADLHISHLLYLEVHDTFIRESGVKPHENDEYDLLSVENMGVGIPTEISPKKEFIQKIKQILLIEDESLNLINEL